MIITDYGKLSILLLTRMVIVIEFSPAMTGHRRETSYTGFASFRPGSNAECRVSKEALQDRHSGPDPESSVFNLDLSYYRNGKSRIVVKPLL